MTKAKIIVIGDAPLVMGFGLAGLENLIQAEESEFQKQLEKAMADPEYGIIIANERLIEKLDWKIKKKIDTVAYPVIIPIPDYNGTSQAGDEIRNLIKRALGFDLGAKK